MKNKQSIKSVIISQTLPSRPGQKGKGFMLLTFSKLSRTICLAAYDKQSCRITDINVLIDRVCQSIS